MLAGKTIVLGATGGIAVHYLPELIGTLRWRHLVNVRVIMTEAATRFITPLTLETASGNPVSVDMFQATREWPVVHIQLARLADLVLVAPATANTIGKVALGLADNLLTAVVMATTAPVVFAPAMNDRMWANPIVRENVAKLKRLGYHFVGPEKGLLATGDIGLGRMANLNAIIRKLIEVAKEHDEEEKEE